MAQEKYCEELQKTKRVFRLDGTNGCSRCGAVCMRLAEGHGGAQSRTGIMHIFDRENRKGNP